MYGRQNGGGGDPIAKAVHDALLPVAELDKKFPLGLVQTKLTGYLYDAASCLDFTSGPWYDLVHQYCDNVFASVFQGVLERDWLNEVDFLLVVDAGVRTTFPTPMLASLPVEVVQDAVLKAHDRTYEEHRYAIVLWDTVSPVVKDPRAKKQVFDAFEAGRKGAVKQLYQIWEAGDEPGGIEPFLGNWVRATVEHLAGSAAGSLDQLLPPDSAVQLFRALVELGMLPMPLVAERGPPPRGWPLVESVVQGCYEKWSGGGWGSKRSSSWGSASDWGSSWQTGGKKKRRGGAKTSTTAEDEKSPEAQTKPIAEVAPGVARSSPTCSRGADCLGGPDIGLVQQLDANDVPRTFFCELCWLLASADDTTIRCVSYPPQPGVDLWQADPAALGPSGAAAP